MFRKNFFYNFLLTGSQFIFPLISFPYASRILGPQGIGSVSFIDSFTQYFLLLAALGIPVYGIREVAKVKDDTAKLNNLFNEIFAIQFISALSFCLIYISLSFFLDRLFNQFTLVSIGVSIVLLNSFSFEWFFQGIGNFSYVAVRSVVAKSLSLILLFIILQDGSSPKIYYLITASVFLINALSNMFYIKKHVHISFKSLKILKHLKPLVILLSSTVAINVYVLMDNVILGFIKGNTDVGYYSTAVRIMRIPLVFIASISAVIIPAISKAYAEKNTGEVNDLANKSFSFISILGIPLMVGVIISAKFIVFTFAGTDFENSVIVLQTLAPCIVIVGLSNLFGLQLLSTFNNEKLLLRAVLIGMCVSLVFNLVLIPRFSFIGAAFTNLITEIIVTTLCYFYIKRRFAFINLSIKTSLVPFLVSISFFIIAFFIRRINLSFLVQEISIIVFCGIVYILTLWSFFKKFISGRIKGFSLSKMPV